MIFDLLSAMKVFVSVADAGSLTKAADRLGLSVSAVSHAIKRLEQHLATQLLFRDSRSLTLTEPGRRFLEHARKIGTQVAEARQSLLQKREGLAGRLVLGLPMAFGNKVLLPELRTFMAAHPDLTLELRMEDTIAHLDRSGLDLAVRIGPQRDVHAVYRLVGYLPVVYVAAPDYLAEHGEPASLADLAGHHVIDHRFTDSGKTFPHISVGVDGTSAVPVDARLVCSSDLTLESAAAAGLGIAPVLMHCVATELASGALVRVLPNSPVLSPPLWIVYPRRSAGNARVKAFIQFLVATLDGPGGCVHPTPRGHGAGTSLLPLVG